MVSLCPEIGELGAGTLKERSVGFHLGYQCSWQHWGGETPIPLFSCEAQFAKPFCKKGEAEDLACMAPSHEFFRYFWRQLQDCLGNGCLPFRHCDRRKGTTKVSLIPVARGGCCNEFGQT